MACRRYAAKAFEETRSALIGNWNATLARSIARPSTAWIWFAIPQLFADGDWIVHPGLARVA